ncbi:2-oxoglutarate dehydrogenase E1 component [soil metagenome]
MSNASAFAGPYNRDILEATYQQFQKDPASVDATWQAFFAGMEFSGLTPASATSGDCSDQARCQAGAVRLIAAYRDLGHLAANIDPLSETAPEYPWLISLDRFHLKAEDFEQPIDAQMYFGMSGMVPLKTVHEALRETYCGTVGFEYMHLQDIPARKWLAHRIEPSRSRPNLPRRERLRTLMMLHDAELFERFLHTKYVGQKRFSLEGGETMLPMLDALIQKCPSLGLQEIVIGMAHRGRLNVLANVLHMPFEELFNEFEDRWLPDQWDGDGDVKYHIGYSADVAADGGKVHISLTPNPSHLEIVNPVVEGRVRAKQRLHNDVDRSRGMALLIHGDAAFAGQGVVAETLNMAGLSGYRTGGTVHIIINNQIGFTTSPRDARSTQYCTDVAKFVQAPIFHVNGDDPESAVMIAELALAFRQEFKRDVVIDLVCYRKWGHNEADEPSFTHPVLYKKIKDKASVVSIYAKKLVDEGVIAQDEADAIAADFKTQLEAALKEVKNTPPRKKGMKGFQGTWDGLGTNYSHTPAHTAVSKEVLERIADRIATVPETFTPHPKLKDLLGSRRDAVHHNKSIDWGTGEALAFGSLVLEGHTVRLSGQDCRRGTFSHRHCVLYDYNTGESFCPLDRLDPKQAPFDVFDSLLSEAAVLGFEYGYSLDDPNALVIWEAQFGDFFNGAQVIIDQFISSGESKWKRSSGLVLLLPHGYEGSGPEHSSARPERFLQMCAEDNMHVCNFTTPANFFHALRRQLKRGFRKPLIVMTPKSLLRHPMAVSTVEDFTQGRFQEVIDDAGANPESVRRVLLCTGKVSYELIAERAKRHTDQVAIIRLEQMYPWPEQQLQQVLAKYRRAIEWKWVQEESQNNGAWFFVEPRLRTMGFPFEYVGRDASASPSTGSNFIHHHEQAALIEQAFTADGSYAVTTGKPGTNGVHEPHGVPV